MNARRRLRASFKRSLAALKAPARPVRRPVAPSDVERQRILDGVLAALRQLTSGVA